MKLRLDECVDRRFAREITNHTVKTVPQMGWATIKNGELLSLAEKEFDSFITVDRNLSFQLNVVNYDISVIVMHAPSNRVVDLKPLVNDVLQELSKVAPGDVVNVGI